ncbi:Beta-galactosidase [Pontiella desulfatans]|uniref:Beta-galactosidase n=1 Tax=Pontiella desulfatans TaxID=2750659 RepID=A0A6C2TXD4_PONDE|nr:sugar-binding domain-containing protein [Pontiella desulfatans]VGO11991.1 Beta-galactosidase [Pontiella desulfatans]
MKVIITMVVLLAFSMAGHAGLRDVQSLDGEWNIVFDEANEGRQAAWHVQETFNELESRPIQVPSCWEEIEQDYEGVATYGKTFKVSRDWKGKTVRLQFDAVNYIAEVWLNDHCVGRHEGGYGPFEFQVDDLLKFGQENFLSLRVVGPIVTREDLVIDGLGKNDAPHWRGAIVGGIWQSVRLVASGSVTVDDLFVIPQLKDDTARVQLQLENTDTKRGDARVSVSVSDENGVVAEKSKKLKLLPGKNKADWTLQIPDAKYWSPDAPNLYTVSVTVEGSDAETVRFGMRELTVKDKEFVLNGKPIYIKAAFFEGLYPTRLALPDNREMAIREIQLAKDAGFNMIRPWRKPPPPEWLDLCDEMGVLVIGGLPIECMRQWPTVTPEMPRRIENEVRTAILRDRNRACIVQWEIFNEIWRKELKRMKHPMSMLARELDPSRMILDESGGFADGANIYLPYEVEPVKFNDIHMYLGAPLNDKTYAQILALGMTDAEMQALGYEPDELKNKHAHAGLMSLVSEIGYGSIPDVVDNNRRFREKGNPLVPPYRYHQMLEETTAAVLKESGLDAIYPDVQQFCIEQQKIHSDVNKRMVEAIRSNPMVRGYCVHALTGGDWVLGAGLLDLWRNPKASYYGTKEANAPRYLAVRVMPRNIYAGQPAKVTVTGINDLDAVDGKLEVRLLDADGKVVKKWKHKVELAGGISGLLEEALDASKLSGAYKAEVKLTGKSGVMAQNTFGFNVFGAADLQVPSAKIAVLDSTDALTPFLKGRGIAFVEFDETTPKSMPVYVVDNVANTKPLKATFRALENFVKQGGTAVYLQAMLRPGNIYWSGKLPSDEVLPIKKGKKHALGLWVGVSHIVTDHPVFAGLPVNTMMGQEYENVWSPYVLSDMGNDLIVGSVSYGFYAGDKTHMQSYIGPEPAFYGMDMGIVKHGDGRYVLSTLRLIENLGSDPVADKILFNLINWTAR